MTFVLLSVVFIAASVGCWAGLPRHRFLVALPSIALLFPFVLDFALPRVQPLFPGDLPIDVSYWPWSVSAAAGSGAGVFSMLLLLTVRRRLPWSNLPSALLCLLLSLYLLLATLSHTRFVSPPAHVSLVNLASLRLVDPLTDVHCDARSILIAKDSTGAIHYRCPTTLLFGTLTRHPFLPWPDYTEGVSVDLLSVLNESSRLAP